jgi:hypothetical protein
VGIRCADHVRPSTRKNRHYFTDSGGRSVGIVRLRTKATEFYGLEMTKTLQLMLGRGRGLEYMIPDDWLKTALLLMAFRGELCNNMNPKSRSCPDVHHILHKHTKLYIYLVFHTHVKLRFSAYRKIKS